MYKTNSEIQIIYDEDNYREVQNYFLNHIFLKKQETILITSSSLMLPEVKASKLGNYSFSLRTVHFNFQYLWSIRFSRYI